VSKLEPIHSISPKVNEQLEAHLALMGEMGASATPAIDYLEDAGRLLQQQVAPRPIR
jgi:thiol:disulfide interchange protein DsbG